MPKLLWITRDRPFPPNFGGDWIYSSRLIAEAARAGAEVTVLSAAQGGPPPKDYPASVRWLAADGPRPLSPWLLTSGLPTIVTRHGTPAAVSVLRDALAEGGWDAVVIDHIGAAWSLPHLMRRSVPIIYMSHNHETSVRREVARAAKGSPWRRLAIGWDATKVTPLETALVKAAMLITANTEEDAALFQRDRPDARITVLKPGYDGPIETACDLGPRERNVAFLGSFNWIAKQANLLSFLDRAHGGLTAAGVGVLVVGAMPDAFRQQLTAAYPGVTVTGAVDDVAPWLRRARIGILAEESGGGFKHKALSYVFAGLPVMALDGAYAGLPVRPNESILSYPDMQALAAAIPLTIDRTELLHAIRDAAFRACEGQFDWSDRGARLIEALGAEDAR